MGNPNFGGFTDSGETPDERREYLEAVCSTAVARAAVEADMQPDYFNSLSGTRQIGFDD